jgi:hypothetical protein
MEWLTKYKEGVVMGILIFLTATTSFALGYLMGRDHSRAPIIIEKNSN